MRGGGDWLPLFWLLLGVLLLAKALGRLRPWLRRKFRRKAHPTGMEETGWIGPSHSDN